MYSIPPLAQFAVEPRDGAFSPTADALASTPGLSASGIDETFSTAAPVSLYGATKLASEVLALEYGDAFDIAQAVIHVGSPVTGKFITGEVLVVDGGNQMWGDVWPGTIPDWFRVPNR